MNYFEKSTLILSDVIRGNRKTLTREQCKVIAECFNILSSEEEVTKKVFCDIDTKLMNVGLDCFAPFTD